MKIPWEFLIYLFDLIFFEWYLSSKISLADLSSNGFEFLLTVYGVFSLNTLFP